MGERQFPDRACIVPLSEWACSTGCYFFRCVAASHSVAPNPHRRHVLRWWWVLRPLCTVRAGSRNRRLGGMLKAVPMSFIATFCRPLAGGIGHSLHRTRPLRSQKDSHSSSLPALVERSTAGAVLERAGAGTLAFFAIGTFAAEVLLGRFGVVDAGT